MSAFEVTFEIAIEIDGTIVTPPPLAPVCACVVIACCAVRMQRQIVRVGEETRVLDPGEGRVVHDRERERDTEAEVGAARSGRPGTPSPCDSLVEAALSEASPRPASTEAPERIAAAVSTLTMLIETEPATPTEPPPAPEVDSAPNRLVVSPATFVSTASAANPTATTTAPLSTTDSFVTFARLIATPAPTLIPSPVVDAEPSAFAFESVFADDFSVSEPPAVTWIPPGTNAREELFEMLIPTAAATLTPPLEVDALGVEPAPPES